MMGKGGVRACVGTREVRRYEWNRSEDGDDAKQMMRQERERKQAARRRAVPYLANVLDELLLVAGERGIGRSLQELARANTLLLDGRQATSEHGLANECHRHAKVQRGDGGPLASSFLLP